MIVGSKIFDSVVKITRVNITFKVEEVEAIINLFILVNTIDTNPVENVKTVVKKVTTKNKNTNAIPNIQLRTANDIVKVPVVSDIDYKGGMANEPTKPKIAFLEKDLNSAIDYSELVTTFVVNVFIC